MKELLLREVTDTTPHESEILFTKFRTLKNRVRGTTVFSSHLGVNLDNGCFHWTRAIRIVSLLMSITSLRVFLPLGQEDSALFRFFRECVAVGWSLKSPKLDKAVAASLHGCGAVAELKLLIRKDLHVDSRRIPRLRSCGRFLEAGTGRILLTSLRTLRFPIRRFL
jgi:hypothetical protein